MLPQQTTDLSGAERRPSMLGSRLFVTMIFTALGAGFLASTWLMVSEFNDAGWLPLLLGHSHLFLFFPTFGIVALLAFHLPSVVFTHLYWHHLPYGRLRFLFGFAVALAITAVVTTFVLGPTVYPRALWEVAPQALTSDRGEPANCMASTTEQCRRGAILPVLYSLRDKAQTRTGLSRFARLCEPDPLGEPPEENGKMRWCFPANRMMLAEDCCKVQKAFAESVNNRVQVRETRSVVADRDVLLQPLKIFFVLVVLVIGAMLVLWREQVEQHYPHYSRRIERNVLVGGLAMLLWPIMDYAHLDVTNVLFGRWTDEVQWRLSIVVAPWSLLLLFYFLRRFARKVEILGQIIGVAGGLGALVVRDELKDFAVRYLGIGMPPWMFITLAVLWVTALLALCIPVGDAPRHSNEPKAQRA